jgi:hypothetical protein
MDPAQARGPRIACEVIDGRGNISGRPRVLHCAIPFLRKELQVRDPEDRGIAFTSTSERSMRMQIDENRHGELSRRSLIKTAIRALAGIAIVSLTATKTSAAEAKLAKSVVQYEDVGKQKGADCDDCAQFIPGKTANALGTCKIVDGAISPHGHCIAFTPKPGK